MLSEHYKEMVSRSTRSMVHSLLSRGEFPPNFDREACIHFGITNAKIIPWLEERAMLDGESVKYERALKEAKQEVVDFVSELDYINERDEENIVEQIWDLLSEEFNQNVEFDNEDYKLIDDEYEIFFSYENGSDATFLKSKWFSYFLPCSPCVPCCGNINDPFENGLPSYCPKPDDWEDAPRFPIYDVETKEIINGVTWNEFKSL